MVVVGGSGQYRITTTTTVNGQKHKDKNRLIQMGGTHMLFGIVFEWHPLRGGGTPPDDPQALP